MSAWKWSRSRRRRMCLLLICSLAFQTTSCGTILHPERMGQRGGRLDPAIVALNGVGLLLFIVPGAIAFAVDFYNGTIYLPPEEYHYLPAPEFRGQSPDDWVSAGWQAVLVEREIQSREQLEAYLLEKTGREIELDPDVIRVSSVKSPPRPDQARRHPFAPENEKLGHWERFLPVLPGMKPESEFPRP
jgi:hypothetical protein